MRYILAWADNTDNIFPGESQWLAIMFRFSPYRKDYGISRK